MRADDEARIVACIPHLRRYSRALLAEREPADDLVQDTLERACRRWSMWQRRGDLRAWMFGIMHNLFIDRLRAQRARPETVADDLPEQVAPIATDRLELRDLDRLLQALPIDQREVLLLVAVEELDYQEVARVLGIPLGTVMSRLSRAREAMRSRLVRRDATVRLARVQ
ncbi:RNA polymerase sigma factor [soil metagenome]